MNVWLLFRRRGTRSSRCENQTQYMCTIAACVHSLYLRAVPHLADERFQSGHEAGHKVGGLEATHSERVDGERLRAVQCAFGSNRTIGYDYYTYTVRVQYLF